MDSAFAAFPEIETERLVLREIMPDDAEQIFALFSDEKVTRHYDLSPLASRQEAHELIDFFDESFEVERGIRWGITYKDEDRLIGTCGYVWLRTHRGEIGYDFASPYWRQGIMSEALDTILDFGYTELQLNRIEASVMLDNLASAGLLESLGFREEGILRQRDFFKGQFHDMRLFSLLKQVYFSD